MPADVCLAEASRSEHQQCSCFLRQIEDSQQKMQTCARLQPHRDVQALEVQQGEEQVQALVRKASTKAEVLQESQVLTAQHRPDQVEAAHSQTTQEPAAGHSRQTCRHSSNQQGDRKVNAHGLDGCLRSRASGAVILPARLVRTIDPVIRTVSDAPD